MSEETALADAEVNERQQHAVVDRLKWQVADSVAGDLPDCIDAHAKALASKQPEATKALGVEGVSILPKELAKAAQNPGTVLKKSTEKIAWAATYEGVSCNLSLKTAAVKAAEKAGNQGIVESIWDDSSRG